MTLNPEQQKLIDEMVASGLYESSDEAIDAALALLDERNRKLEALRKDVQAGLDQLEHGEYTEYTDESLDKLFDGIKRRGRAQRSGNPSHSS